MQRRDRALLAPAREAPSQRAPVRIERFESFDAAREDWSALAVSTRNVFSTWEWASTWWRHFGAGRPLHLLAVRDGARSRAILPLYGFTGRPLRVLRFVGHGTADELGPVCAPHERQLAARELRAAAAKLRADLVLAERLPGDQGWSGLLRGRLLKREASPVVDLDAGSWEELTARWSANWRGQLGRKERKLEREHDVRFQIVTAPAELQSGLDKLFALHTARWPGPESSFAGPRTAFHRDFARLASERGWLRLWLLEVDGQAVAALLVFRFGGVDCFYQSGRDPAWDKASVGTVLMARVIRAALEDGMLEFRMLRGDEAYKYRFAMRDPGVETLAFACRPLGRAALAAQRSVPEFVASPLRRWVSR